MVWCMQWSWWKNAGKNVCSSKGEWVEHGIKGHEVHDSKNVQVQFSLGEEPMGHMKLLLSKGVSLIRGEVG